MANRVAWYDSGWVMPTLAVVTIVATLFPEDIRGAVAGVGVVVFEVVRIGGLIGLVVLVLKNLLADHRSQLKEDLADHRKQLREDLTDLINSRLKPISDGVETLQSNLSSHMSALNNRQATFESRMTAFESKIDVVARSAKQD